MSIIPSGSIAMKILSTTDIGRAIRNKRKAMKLNQGQLAKRLAVSQPWISDVENGKDTVSLGGVLRVLAHLGLSVHVDDRNQNSDGHLPSMDDLMPDGK
ncbi:helix-turn-helix transcriptional regulator [Terasakiella sp.]|uniref:helix-turn-helix transcriptional regulator n=1 Tax=Terasakiella sp. TaxID=2034861 RepID=UPI003AA8330F